MHRRVVLLIICALWTWDVVTPIQPMAPTLEWDEEEEAARAAPARLARPSANDRKVSPALTAQRGTARRIVLHATPRHRWYRPALAPLPRPRMDAALVDSPSEDH